MNGIGKLLSNPFAAKQKQAPKAQEQSKLGKARAVFEDMPSPKSQASTSKGMKGASGAGLVKIGESMMQTRRDESKEVKRVIKIIHEFNIKS